MENVRDYVSVSKLNKEKNIKALEQGVGCIFKKEGALSAYYYNGEPMKYLAYIEFLPDTPRGGHVHQTKVENMCIIKGTLKARYWLLSVPDDILELSLEQGDVVNIKPGCAHIYNSDTGAVALEFSPQNFIDSDSTKLGLDW